MLSCGELGRGTDESAEFISGGVGGINKKKGLFFRSGSFHIPDLLRCTSRCAGTAEETTQKVQMGVKEAGGETNAELLPWPYVR